MSGQGRGDDGAADDDPVTELSYMDASRELDSIVEFFERSEVDVDQLVARLERARAIVDELDRRIRRTRGQVEELVPKLEAATRAAVSDAPTGDEDEEPDGETLPF
jgi:exodeoxyribonuclease VII small subunit